MSYLASQHRKPFIRKAATTGRPAYAAVSPAWWPEMAQNLPCVVGLPRFPGSLGRVLLVQADQQVNQLAAHRPGAQQVPQLRQARSSAPPSKIRNTLW